MPDDHIKAFVERGKTDFQKALEAEMSCIDDKIMIYPISIFSESRDAISREFKS